MKRRAKSNVINPTLGSALVSVKFDPELIYSNIDMGQRLFGHGPTHRLMVVGLIQSFCFLKSNGGFFLHYYFSIFVSLELSSDLFMNPTCIIKPKL